MAIAPIGSVVQVNVATNAGSGSVAVPSGADFCVACATGYDTTVNWMSGGSLTLDGEALTTSPSPADGDTDFFMGNMWFLAGPNVGATKTLAWDWTGAIFSPGFILLRFYSGVAQTTPVRDSDGFQQADTSTATTKTLTAQTGDLIVAFAFTFTGVERTYTWTNATERFEATLNTHADGGLAEASPTGNQTVTAACSVGSDGGLSALVLKPAGGGGTGHTVWPQVMMF